MPHGKHVLALACVFCAGLVAMGLWAQVEEQDLGRQLTEDRVGRVGARSARLIKIVRLVVPGSGFDGEFDPISTGGTLANLLVNFVSALIQIAVAACVYSSFKEVRVTTWAPPGPAGDFPTGLCQCSDTSVFLCSCCCPALRSAQTQHMAGLRQFWPTLLICALLFALPTWIGLFALMAFRFVLRTEIRKAGGLQPDPAGDCLRICCCLWCTICQEANFVNLSLAAPSHTVPHMVVGEPVGEPVKTLD
eukprot:TRINITY_DN80881_c0_g1_i1.p1 TRINITY_DN80881_c0_g1~~TRINITY_DN80881_c0_g1_i1.p1  ORF type:complete len:248 (+),score=26.09 TRINITY_DN80881_c0_g1_i1:65-808(+)